MERKYINIFEDIAKDELLGLLDKYDIDYEITNKGGEKMTILSGEEAKKVLEEVKEIPSKEAIDKARENGKKLVEKYKQYTKQVGEETMKIKFYDELVDREELVQFVARSISAFEEVENTKTLQEEVRKLSDEELTDKAEFADELWGK